MGDSTGDAAVHHARKSTRLRFLCGVLVIGAIVLVNQNWAVLPSTSAPRDRNLRRKANAVQWGPDQRSDFEFVVVSLPYVEPQTAGDALSIIAHTIGRGSGKHDELKDICLIEKYAHDTALQDVLGSNCGPVADRTRLADGLEECTVPCGKMYISFANKGAVVEYDSETTESLLKQFNMPVIRLHQRDLLPTFLQTTADTASNSARFSRVLQLFANFIQQELHLRASVATIPSLPVFVEDVLTEHPAYWCKRLGPNHGCDGAGNLTTPPQHPAPRTALIVEPLRDLVPNPEAWCVALSSTLYLPRSHRDCVHMLLQHSITSRHLPVPTVLPTTMEAQIPLLTNWSTDPFLRECTLPGKIRETDPLGAFIMPVTSPRLKTYASRWVALAGYGYCGKSMFWCEIEGEKHPALAFTETVVACPLPNKFNDRDTVKVQVVTSGDEFAKHVTNLIQVRHRYEQLPVPIEHRRHHKLMICTMVKNEEDNIEEWMNHHIKLGADHFALYVNLEAIPIAFRIQLQEYMELGYVTLHQWPYWFSQTQALNDCLQRYRSYADWMAFIDVDEFYFENFSDNFPQFNVVDRIQSITSQRDDACAYIREHVYCKRDSLARTDQPIAERFPSRMEYMQQHKPIFQPNATMGVRAYGPHYILRIRPNRDSLNSACPLIEEGPGLVLKHFRFKSLEEYVSRRQGPDSVFYHEYKADKLAEAWHEANQKCAA